MGNAHLVIHVVILSISYTSLGKERIMEKDCDHHVVHAFKK